MICATCHHENRDSAVFCERCGGRLARACPSCGTEPRVGARFCDECGARLDDRRVAPAAHAPDRASESEHRNVTVLFIDAVSSVAATERLRAEDHHRIVRECTEHMSRAVRRYEGTVTQFRGDGIMAIFGAPIAHEDSARRAVAAALEMRQSLDEYARQLRATGVAPFAYRTGINTGPVIVGRIGADDSIDYTAVGDTVNLASRMEQWAPPGKIYITENTRRLVAPYFELSDLGQLEVKGKSDLVRAYEVVRELPHRTRIDISLERGLTPYVGRERELAMLRGFFEHAAAGRGQVVFISGEAGIGKSRLLFEFRRSLGSDAQWIEGHCISYGAGMPFVPIVDVVRACIGVEEGDSVPAVARKVEVATSRWSEDARRLGAHLKFLLNVEDSPDGVDPAVRRAGIIDALRAMILTASADRPLVVIIEDLHWVDEMSEGAIASLVDVLASARVLLLLTYRPGYTHSLGERTYYSRIALQNFGSSETATLVEQVLEASDLPDGLRDAIAARAEGNPFFVEEVARSLIESGTLRRDNGRCVLVKPIEQVLIPDTLQEVILTRIDRLEREAREAIQLAAVIGREFTVRLLQRITETHARLEGVLAGLKSLELIYEKQYFPELSYMFKHALTHEVALSTLLSDRRKVLHRLVAAAIEEIYADRLPQQYEVLAHHYFEGGDWQPAFDYLVKSGDRARDAFAIKDAIAFYDRAILLVERGHIPGSPEAHVRDLRGRKGTCFYLLGKWAEAREELTASVGMSGEPDSEERANRLLDLALACFWLLDVSAARKYGEEGAAIGKRLDIPRVLATAEGTIAAVESAEGDIEGALVRFNRVLAHIGESSTTKIQPRLLDHYSLVAYWTGSVDHAIEVSTNNTRLERELTDIQNLMQGLPHLGLALAASGRYSEALDVFAEAREVGERYEVKTLLSRALCMSSGMLGDLFDYARAEERAAEARDLARSMSFMPPLISSGLDLIFFRTRSGDVARAQSLVNEVGDMLGQAGGWHAWLFGLRYQQALAELAVARGDYEDALAHAADAIAYARAKRRVKYEALGHRARALAQLALGQHQGARESFRMSLDLAMRFGDPALIVRVGAAALPVLDGESDLVDIRAAAERIRVELPPGPLRSVFESSAEMAALRAVR